VPRLLNASAGGNSLEQGPVAKNPVHLSRLRTSHSIKHKTPITR